MIGLAMFYQVLVIYGPSRSFHFLAPSFVSSR